MEQLKKILFLSLVLFNLQALCQSHNLVSDSLPFSSQKPFIKDQTSNISFTGFYRFLGFVRDQTHTFPNNSGKTTAILVGDAYREPMLLLKMRGVTKDEIQFGADFMINSLYKGVNESLYKELTLELGLNIRTTIPTRYGKFNIKTGGCLLYTSPSPRD